MVRPEPIMVYTIYAIVLFGAVSEAVLVFRWAGEHDDTSEATDEVNLGPAAPDLRGSGATDRASGLGWAERPRAQPPDKIQNSLSSLGSSEVGLGRGGEAEGFGQMGA